MDSTNDQPWKLAEQVVDGSLERLRAFNSERLALDDEQRARFETWVIGRCLSEISPEAFDKIMQAWARYKRRIVRG